MEDFFAFVFPGVGFCENSVFFCILQALCVGGENGRSSSITKELLL